MHEKRNIAWMEVYEKFWWAKSFETPAVGNCNVKVCLSKLFDLKSLICLSLPNLGLCLSSKPS